MYNLLRPSSVLRKSSNLFIDKSKSEAFFLIKRNGSGIGLSLSKRFAELHTGTLFVKSKEGEGSSFTLRLPFNLSKVPSEQIDKASALNAKNEQIDKSFVAHSESTPRVKKALINGEKQRELILLVEDNEDILIVLDDILSEDYDLIHAVNGKTS